MSVSVHQLLVDCTSNGAALNEAKVEVEGWLTIMDAGLYLLGSNNLEGRASNKRIGIKNSEIIYAIRDQILPMGGRSFVFHQAKVLGRMESIDPALVCVETIFLRRRNSAYFIVDIRPETIDQGKKNMEKIFLRLIMAYPRTGWTIFKKSCSEVLLHKSSTLNKEVAPIVRTGNPVF